MSGNMTPDYLYWSAFDTLPIWELTVLMYGVEPREFQDVVIQSPDDPNDVHGISPDLTFYETQVQSAINAGFLTPCAPNQHPATTQIPVSQLIPWLETKGYAALATGLHSRAPGFSSPASPIATSIQPVQRQQAQESAILGEIQKLGHDSAQLPRNPPGKGGVKRDVRVKLGSHPAFSASTSFDRAWERLRKSGEIKDG